MKQAPWSSSFMSKFLLVTIFTLALYTVVVNGYLGPRYGKRVPLPERGQSGPYRPRARNGFDPGSRFRFYQNSRYGKRSSVMPNDLDVNSFSTDCVYVPYVGVRCGDADPDSSLEQFSQSGSVLGREPEEETPWARRDMTSKS